MELNNVYEAISTEITYQKQMTERDDRPDMISDFHVGDGLCAIQYNLDKAREKWYKDSVPHQETLEYLRKIAAICVKLGLEYGMPSRFS